MNATIQKTWMLVREQWNMVWALAFFSGWMYALFNSHALSLVIMRISGVNISVMFASLLCSTLVLLVSAVVLDRCDEKIVRYLPVVSALFMGLAGLLFAVGGPEHQSLLIPGALCSGIGTGLAPVFFGSVMVRQSMAENLIDMIVGSTVAAALVGLVAGSLAVELYWASLVILPLCMVGFCRRVHAGAEKPKDLAQVEGMGMPKMRFGLLIVLLVAVGAMFGASRAHPTESGAPEPSLYVFIAGLLVAAVSMAIAYLFSTGRHHALLSFSIVLAIFSTTLIVAISLFYSPILVFATQTVTTAWGAVILWVVCADAFAHRNSSARDFVIGIALSQVGQLTGAVVMDVAFPEVSGFYPAIIAAYLTAVIPVLFFTKDTSARSASVLVDVSPAQSVLVERGDLTERESEILRLLLEGDDRAAIAHRLVISEETVKTHVRNIYRKLDVHSRFELLALAQKSLGSRSDS